MLNTETLHKHISLYLREKYPEWEWEDSTGKTCCPILDHYQIILCRFKDERPVRATGFFIPKKAGTEERLVKSIRIKIDEAISYSEEQGRAMARSIQ